MYCYASVRYRIWPYSIYICILTQFVLDLLSCSWSALNDLRHRKCCVFDHSSKKTIRPNKPINQNVFWCLGNLSGESISMHEHGPKILQQRARKLQRDADCFPSGGSILHRSHWEPANHDFQVLPESANKTWSAGKTLIVWNAEILYNSNHFWWTKKALVLDLFEYPEASWK